MDVCKLGKTEVILKILWLAAHNPEINWEIGEVRITRCPPLCGQIPEKKEIKGRQTTKEDENDLRWTICHNPMTTSGHTSLLPSELTV